MAKTIFYLLLCVYVTSSVYGASKKWIDSRFVRFENRQELTSPAPTTTPLPDESYCKAAGAGYQCAGCEKVLFCYIQDGAWTAMEFQTCDLVGKNETCNKGSCITGYNRECSDDPFVCKQGEGMYPDPSSCKKFKYCVPESPDNNKLTPFTSSCSYGTAYNARTTYCDKNLPNDICNGYPVPECTRPAQTAALIENPSIFYTCLPISQGSRLLFPVLGSCRNGKTYDAAKGMCNK